MCFYVIQTVYLTCPVMRFCMHDWQCWLGLVIIKRWIRFLCPLPKFTQNILPNKFFGKNVMCIAIQLSLKHINGKLGNRMSASSNVQPRFIKLSTFKILISGSLPRSLSTCVVLDILKNFYFWSGNFHDHTDKYDTILTFCLLLYNFFKANIPDFLYTVFENEYLLHFCLRWKYCHSNTVCGTYSICKRHRWKKKLSYMYVSYSGYPTNPKPRISEQLTVCFKWQIQ